MTTPRLLVFEEGHGLSSQLSGALAARRQDADVVACSDADDLGGLLSGEEPFDVLIAGDAMTQQFGYQGLRLIRDEVPTVSVLLALGRPPEAPLAEVVGAGALDLLELPVSDAELLAAVDRALAHRRAVTAQPALVAAPEPVEVPDTKARVYTIASASGGCGKTFLATNLAWFLNHHVGGTTCIIDLDLQFGEVTSSLRMKPRFTIADLLQQSSEDEVALEDIIEEYTDGHETGIRVLAAPRDPIEAESITAPDVGRVIDAAAKRFDHVIIDTPPALADTVIVALHRSDALYVMATLDVPSVRNLSVFLGTLDRLNVAQDNLHLMLNKAETDVGVDVSQVLKLFPQGFDATLPYAREVTRSINAGNPVLVTAPSAQISRLLLAGLAVHLAPDRATAFASSASRSPRLFRKRA